MKISRQVSEWMGIHFAEIFGEEIRTNLEIGIQILQSYLGFGGVKGTPFRAFSGGV